MTEAIAVFNAGSSSIKISLFDLAGQRLQLLARGQIEGLPSKPHLFIKGPATATGGNRELLSELRWPEGTHLSHDEALHALSDELNKHFSEHRWIAAGHRVVHGGLHYAEPIQVDASLLEQLQQLIPLAPLHQPHNLGPIRWLQQQLPELPQIACFDTAFHRSNPDLAQRFAIPQALHDEGVRRYGFHGLSYEYIASRLPAIDAKAAAGKTIVLHLGNGASMCALQSGRSIASTMGFTAVDGLPMGTRSGAIDPGVLLYLMDRHDMNARDLENFLYKQSGLLGVSGLSSDMRTLLASEAPAARLAVDLFVYRIRRELGSLSAALGGLDALVFTGGIGENAASIRARVLEDAAWLGVKPVADCAHCSGPSLTQADSPVRAWVIPTNEELMIAQHVLTLLPNNSEC